MSDVGVMSITYVRCGRNEEMSYIGVMRRKYVICRRDEEKRIVQVVCGLQIYTNDTI